jgi:hypothetical protein
MNMIYRYLSIMVAGAAILVGIQIPNFIDQYEKRLDAHMIEVTANLRGFQAIADKYHQGSFEALLREHENSASPTFQGEAKPLRTMYERYKTFFAEQLAMKTSLPGKAVHLLLKGNRELVDETHTNYSFNVPLSSDAVFSGILFAVLAMGLLEAIVHLSGALFRLAVRSVRRKPYATARR